MDHKDYYKILRVNRNASISEIKSAYRKLIRRYHPDYNSGDKEAEEYAKLINEAYDVLNDLQKRRQYDILQEFKDTLEPAKTQKKSSEQEVPPQKHKARKTSVDAKTTGVQEQEDTETQEEWELQAEKIDSDLFFTLFFDSLSVLMLVILIGLILYFRTNAVLVYNDNNLYRFQKIGQLVMGIALPIVLFGISFMLAWFYHHKKKLTSEPVGCGGVVFGFLMINIAYLIIYLVLLRTTKLLNDDQIMIIVISSVICFGFNIAVGWFYYRIRKMSLKRILKT